MPLKAPAYVAPCVWCGFYVGLNAGYADTQTTVTNAVGPTPDGALGVVPGVSEGLAALDSGRIPAGSGTGFGGGGQIGYNLQLTPVWVTGIEADIQGMTGSSNGSVTTGGVVIGVPITTTETASV